MGRWSPTMHWPRMWQFGLQDDWRHYGSIALRVEKVDVGYGRERDREREQGRGDGGSNGDRERERRGVVGYI